MGMELDKEILQDIALEWFYTGDSKEEIENYNKDLKDFLYCYEMVRKYPCVTSRDEGSLINCLYRIAWDIASNEWFKSKEKYKGIEYEAYSDKYKNLNEIIEDALYRTYGDASVKSLSLGYRKNHQLY